MLETFKARLKAKTTAAGVNLSQKRIDAIADRLHKKFPDLTEEKDHDEKLDDLDEVQPFKELAAYDDYQRAKEKKEAEKKAKELADKKKKEQVEDVEIDESDDTPKWAKGLIESNKKLSADLALLQSEKAQGTIKTKVSEKLKDVPVDFYDEWKLPENEEGIETFVEKVNTKYKVFAENIEKGKTENGLSAQTPPASGTTKDTKKASDKEIADVVKNIM